MVEIASEGQIPHPIEIHENKQEKLATLRSVLIERFLPLGAVGVLNEKPGVNTLVSETVPGFYRANLRRSGSDIVGFTVVLGPTITSESSFAENQLAPGTLILRVDERKGVASEPQVTRIKEGEVGVGERVDEDATLHDLLVEYQAGISRMLDEEKQIQEQIKMFQDLKTSGAPDVTTSIASETL